MITEKYLKDNFLKAYFIDNERKNIEILTTSEDKKTVIPTIIQFDEKHPSFIALSKYISIDKLHEETHNKKKKERETIQKEMAELAKKRQDFIVNESKNTKSQDDLGKWWMECIGKHAARDPRVIALKDAAKERLSK